MLSDEVIDKVVERLVDRIEEVNTYTLQKIGESIKKIGTLSPSDANKLGQMMKYGGDYDKIIKKLAEVTNLNVKEIYEIFSEIAKKELNFAKQFYDYREKKFIPYEDNYALRQQVEAMARLTSNEYLRLSRTLAFVMRDEKGGVLYTDLNRTYQNAIDEAVLSISQGKDTFNNQMHKIIKELGESGIKTVDYASGRSLRLDSAVRMCVKSGITNLHNEIQKQIGEEIESDGVEISVHNNPAPDHAQAQGKQFSTKEDENGGLSEYDKLQTYGVAKDYTGEEINLHRELKDGKEATGFRPIGAYNCYHYTFSIILGVNQPQYSKEKLKDIIKKNEDGFELDGEHYTNYEGTQMQRQLETKIREAKDTQIIARASGNDDLVRESQQKITQLTRKYKELSEASGLPTKANRLRVSGYKRVAVGNAPRPMQNTTPQPKPKTPISKDTFVISKEDQTRRIGYRREYLNEKILMTQDRISQYPETSQRSYDITMRKNWTNDLNKYKKELASLDASNIEEKTITLNTREDCIDLLGEVNIKLNSKNLDKIDLDVLKANTKHYYEICNKYPFLEQTLQEKGLKLEFDNLPGGTIGMAERGGGRIQLEISDFNKKEDTIYWGEYQTKSNYNMPCSKDNYINYFATHELGHTFDYRVLENVEIDTTKDLSAREFYEKTNEYFMDRIYEVAEKNSGLTREELTNMISDYGKTNIEETMAELFANANCGKPNELGKAYDEYFKELLK